MGIVDRKKALFENIARLRRAERELPPSSDIAWVRGALEDELGETVSLRLAARFLGVSHTGLRRWISGGDLPTVFDSSGRQGVPVAALLELYEAVETERQSGRRRRHVLEPTMAEGRANAERLDSLQLVPADEGDGGGHRKAERRSLAYHRALARRLRRPMVDEALRQVWKWRRQDKIAPRYAAQWEDILRRPVAEVRRAIAEDSEAARTLRQTSPFAGMLSEAERLKILQEIR